MELAHDQPHSILVFFEFGGLRCGGGPWLLLRAAAMSNVRGTPTKTRGLEASEHYLSPGGKKPDPSGEPFWEEEEHVDPKTPEAVRRWALHGANPVMKNERGRMRKDIFLHQRDLEMSGAQREVLLDKTIAEMQDGSALIQDIGVEMDRTAAARSAMQAEKDSTERDLGDISDQVPSCVPASFCLTVLRPGVSKRPS